ncbi:hypothetical protein Tco_1517277 [Tanacetum coccineum]
MKGCRLQLAQQMQTEEQEQLSIEEKSKLFVELLEKRKKHFAALRAQEKRNKPPTKAQNRNTMRLYDKEMKSAIDATLLATKPPVIVEWKIIKEGKMGYFQLIRTDGSSKRPEEAYERVLWGDLKVMFKPDMESGVWRSLEGHNVIVWKLFSLSGMHFREMKEKGPGSSKQTPTKNQDALKMLRDKGMKKLKDKEMHKRKEMDVATKAVKLALMVEKENNHQLEEGGDNKRKRENRDDDMKKIKIIGEKMENASEYKPCMICKKMHRGNYWHEDYRNCGKSRHATKESQESQEEMGYSGNRVEYKDTQPRKTMERVFQLTAENARDTP